MSKDPAFLFYSKDFYEGTRMMLPEERACYIDLMIYQHQNGFIPNDIRRIQMYCSGCSTETINQVLNQKFNQTVDGWFNEKMAGVSENRQESKPKKKAAATFAGLMSSRKLTEKQKKKIRSEFNMNDFIYDDGELITDMDVVKENVREWFNHMVDQIVNNIAIANAIANEDINENIIEKEKGGVGEKTKTEKKELVMPWDTETFKAQWQHWKIFKKKEFRFNYKSIQSEQAALTELSNKAGGDEKTAIAIIHQSMANGWKGFFELKNRKNEQANHNTSGGASDEFRRKTAERLGLV